MKKNIVLIGFRCTGKSSVAKVISSKLGIPMVSTDELIVKKVGNISEYVKNNDWVSFREIENEVIKNIDADDCVVDSGGGVVERNNNIMQLKKKGIIFLLKADVVSIAKRMKKNGNRPSLTNVDSLNEIEDVLAKRSPLYEKAADFEIETEGKDIDMIADEIISIHKNMEELKMTDAPQKIAAVVAEETFEKTIESLEEAEKIADIVEIRIDHIKNINSETLKQILKKKTKQIIITNRKKDEGGKFEGSEDERIGLLRKAVESGADFVDIELSSGMETVKDIIKNKRGSKIICSYHNFEMFPEDIHEIFNKLKETDADIIKIVCMARKSGDNITMLKLIERACKKNVKIIAFNMGRKGRITRALSGALGAFLTSYVPINKNTAPGQISIEEIEEIKNRIK